MVYYSLLSGTTDGSIYIHDILTPVGVADYKCPLITSVRGRYVYKVGVTSIIWFLLVLDPRHTVMEYQWSSGILMILEYLRVLQLIRR